jgi:sigma-E factor negative regulatory protein RseB
MLTSVGSTRTLMLQQGDWWVTVMGDVPLATVRLFAYGLERSRK